MYAIHRKILLLVIMPLLCILSYHAYAASPLPRLHTEGNRFLNENGKEVYLRGVSLCSLSWDNAPALIRQLKKDDWHVNLVRLPIQPKEWKRGDFNYYIKDKIDPAVAACVEEGYYCIIDWHAITEWNKPETEKDLKQFWANVAPRYADNPNILYEVFNEPTEPKARTEENWLAWRQKAQSWVTMLRHLAPKTHIIIGNPHWDQMPNFAVKHPFEGGNLSYAVHIYSIVSQKIWDEMFGDAATHIPLIMTEFGWSSADKHNTIYGSATHADFATPFKDYMDARPQIGWTAWSYDKQCGPAMLGQDKEDMGHFVKEWLKNAAQPKNE